MIKLDKINEVYVRVNCDLGEALELKAWMEVFANNYRFHPKFRARLWNGKISYFDMRTRLLPIGLLNKFHAWTKNYNYKYKFNFPTSTLYNKLARTTVEEFSNGLVNDYGFNPYDYQIDAIHNSITNKRGIILSPTASGKSLAIYLTIRLLLTQKEDRKILLVVPTQSLVEQMYSDFRSYGWEDQTDHVTKLYSGLDPDYDKNVLISTWQSLMRKSSRFFENYEAVIIDEVHTAKAFNLQQILKKCTNAQYRLGYTGTLPTSDADTMSIYGYLGNVIFSQKSSELIDKGILSNITIVNYLLKYPQDMIEKNRYRPYHEEVDTINEYKPRNKILKHIIDNIQDGQNSLILCTKIDHMERIQEYLEDNLDTSKYLIANIYGKTAVEEREYLRKLMEKETNMILIGTYATMSTGINIKRLHNIVFASSYKSKIKVLQSIGRGLRKHSDKQKMILWDVVDDMTWTKRTGNPGRNYVYEHWRERLKYYDDQGFKYFNREFKL